MLLDGLTDTRSLVVLFGLVSHRQALLNQSLQSAPVAGSGDFSTVNFVSGNLFDLSDFLARLCLLEWFQSCLGHCDQYLICHFCLKIGWIDASGNVHSAPLISFAWFGHLGIVFCSLDPSCSCKSVEWELGRKFWGYPFSKFSLFKHIFDLRGWHES